MKQLILGLVALVMIALPASAQENFYRQIDVTTYWELYAFADANNYDRRYCAFKTELNTGATIQIRNYWDGRIELLYFDRRRNYTRFSGDAVIAFSNGATYNATVEVGDVRRQLAYYGLHNFFIEDFAANRWIEFVTPDQRVITLDLVGTRHLVNQLGTCFNVLSRLRY